MRRLKHVEIDAADLGKLTRCSEAEFQRQVIKLARLCGWRCAHFRPGMNRRGEWQTAVQGDGAGFPDLLLIRGRKLIVAELKVGKNRVTCEQGLWLDAFLRAGVSVCVWTPENWPQIEATLRAAA